MNEEIKISLSVDDWIIVQSVVTFGSFVLEGHEDVPRMREIMRKIEREMPQGSLFDGEKDQ